MSETPPEDMHQHSPRSAVVLLVRALDCVNLIEPATAREPIRSLLRATVELCTVSSSLIGQPVTLPLQLAQALVDAAEEKGDVP